MEGDWSSREGRLPRLDRDGRTLSDSDYCLPSPPERDLSAIHLSQVSLDGGYGGDVSSEAGSSSEVFHHCQQPSYAHSEGYYSYVSSTDSITPFIDRLKRELEFTDVQENSSSASNHGGSNVKWEESDTDSYVHSPRERTSTTKTNENDSVWHFRGSSGDLVNHSRPTAIPNSNAFRRSSPPHSTDPTKINYPSRVPMFHNASFETVSDHSSRIPTTNLSNNVPRAQPARLQQNICRSCDIPYPGRIQTPLSMEHGDILYSNRLHSNGSACDSSTSDRIQHSNNHREHTRANKAQPQLSYSTRLQAAQPPNKDTNSTRFHATENANSGGKFYSSQNEALHHASRISCNIKDSMNHTNRISSSLNDSSSSMLPNKLHPSLNEPPVRSNAQSNHNEPTARIHANHINRNESSNHSNRLHNYNELPGTMHPAHIDPSNNSSKIYTSKDSSKHSSRGHAILNDSPNRNIPTKALSLVDPNIMNHTGRIHSNHCDSSNNHNGQLNSNHSESNALSNTSRVPSSRASSSDMIGISHSTRSHTNALSEDHISRHSSKNSSGESCAILNQSRIGSHSNSSTPSDISCSSNPLRHSSSSAAVESGSASSFSRIPSHSSLGESANIARSSRVPPPQRHLSQSVLYLSADHRKLFPISTYQPEPPRVVGAVSVSERVTELETRLGGLKALQKKALLSFYQRHQASAPPPPPRRASSASDYKQLKGCVDTTSTGSGSSQGSSNGHKDTVSTSSSNSSGSNSSLLKDSSRQLHRSCGSLSGISGPVIVGRSISVDDWVPARPPKGAHLRPPAATPRPRSPDAVHPQARPSTLVLPDTSESKPSSSQSVSSASPQSAPSTSPQSVDKAVAIRSNLVDSRSTNTRPASPEPPPPPPSPPQHYSDEPLPPPPDPDELAHPPSLSSRHPSPGPQVPTSQTENTLPLESHNSPTNKKAHTGTKSQKMDDKMSDKTSSVDLKPQRLSEVSCVKSNTSTTNQPNKLTNVSNPTDSHFDPRIKQFFSKPQPQFPTSLNCNKGNFKSSLDKTLNLNTSSNIKNSIISPEPSNSESSSLESSLKSQVNSSNLPNHSLNHLIQFENQLNGDIKCLEQMSIESSTEINYKNKKYDTSAINCGDEFYVSQIYPMKTLTKSASVDGQDSFQPAEKLKRRESLPRDSQRPEVKKPLRKSSFRCSERIQQSISTLQNSIQSSSAQPQKDVASKEHISKEDFKDLTSNEENVVTKDIPSKCVSPIDQATKGSAPEETLEKDCLSKTVLSLENFTEEVLREVSSEAVLKDMPQNAISLENWRSTLLCQEPSATKLSMSLSQLDHIGLTDKYLSSFSVKKNCGDGDESKEDNSKDLDCLNECDIDKTCSLSSYQLESTISVGSLQQKKEELVSRLSRKLSVLRAEAAAVAEETSANEELGESVVERVSSAWGSREAARLRSHVADLGRLTALLLTLTTRLARADNALLALSSSHPDKSGLETKRDRLAAQLEEARRLKEKVDRRNEAVTTKLRDRLTAEEFSDFMHFVTLKSKLLLDSREIADKIKLGEEQLQALQMTLSAVT